jgi:hypothetical protein
MLWPFISSNIFLFSCKRAEENYIKKLKQNVGSKANKVIYYL